MSVGPAPTQTPPEMATPGSLTSLLDGLVAIQAQVPAHPLLAAFPETLNLARWRPNQPDPPQLYNWLLPSTNEIRDLSRMRDSITISTRIAIRWTDVEDRMAYVEAAADAYRAISDAAFWSGMRTPPPVSAFATWAVRSSMQTFTEDIGGSPLIGIEFIQAFWLDRHLR